MMMGNNPRIGCYFFINNKNNDVSSFFRLFLKFKIQIDDDDDDDYDDNER